MFKQMLDELLSSYAPIQPMKKEIALPVGAVKRSDNPFEDLPRIPTVDGKGDDTGNIISHVCKLFYPVWNRPDQTYNQRALYMSIYYLRTQSKRGWVRDSSVAKLPVPIGQLETA